MQNMPGRSRGTGEGVTIYDVEYYWLRDHEDLGKADDYPLLMDAGDTASYTTGDETHGTSVLGILIAGNNGFGVTGIAYGASIKLAPTRTVTPPDTDPYINRPNAILLAVADGKPGDVILIEQQEYVCGLTSYGPIEDDLAAFQAIQTATALGFVVVEAAGNSTVDLDQAACAGKFNRSTRDSGAIIVGAGDPPTLTTDRQRRSSSTYGNRVDLQGWGSAVVTTGGGYLQGGSAYPRQAWYTNNFTGTSAASPMVAGAAAVIQAIAIHKNSAPLSPWQVRDLLVEQGSPQLGDTSQHIGPRPNLKNAIDHLPQSAANLTVNITDSDNDGTCSVTDCSLREADRGGQQQHRHNHYPGGEYDLQPGRGR